MSPLVARLDRRWYPSHASNWDDWQFRERILAAMPEEAVILDLGAGAGIVEAMNFRGRATKVCGIDLDPRVTANPFLDEGRVSDGGGIPYPDAAFDLVFSDNVLEHLDRPLDVFREVARVLKPGGTFHFKTPNKWHYMPTIARATPHAFHQFVNRIRGRAHVDTFPTRYRANTKTDVERLAAGAGFTVDAIERIEGRPEYLRISAPTYALGMLYERAVNLSDAFAAFRVVLIGALRKT